MEVVDYQKEYEIGVCGHRWVSSQLEESNDPHQVEQWFAFHIPYSSSCSSPVIKVRPSLPDPFSSVKLFGVRNTHAYGGSSTVSYMCLMVSLLSFLKIVAAWMEVYDPISDTWESLPSPPLPVPPFSVRMHAALESKQQIVVALHCDPKLRNFSTLFIYNISNRCWTKLAHHFGVHPGYPFRIYRTPVAVGNTLYWVSVYFHRGYNDIRKHAHAYDLDRDEWLVGSLNIFCRGVKSPILLEDELLVDKAHTPPLLHLADQKFCIFLHSTNRKHTCSI